MPAPHHVLLLGGHGKVAQLLTPLLLRRGWDVTSVIRSEEQVTAVRALAPHLTTRRDDGDGDNSGEAKVGKLDVLVRSLEAVKEERDARAVLEEVRGVDYVVWSAGAGGKGGSDLTYAIDRDAAIHFIRAAAATPTVTRFLMVSYLGSRRNKPAWWSDEAWAAAEDVNTRVLPHYYRAKLAADEVLYSVSKERASSGFVGINLRPGTLTIEPAGKVELGKTGHSKGKISRESVARVANLLLASEEVKSTWLDLLDGEEEMEEAVARVVREGVNAVEGEDVF
ncbi:NAD(P)-binding protein [Parathielavia hyrcaniae]|uniref:NAD(P)-binding protein n=1 Tax=Parathielavia hyrcaniae TaxID=113614 RepID=A0AAN6PRF3_9PEZI|nr:NAD(P)-binding protein [Parathielavia hyrcaniae]